MSARRVGILANHVSAMPGASNQPQAPPSKKPTTTWMSADEIAQLSLVDLQKRFGAAKKDGIQVDGINHCAWVSSNMARTLWFWCEVLGCQLTKTIQLPDGGQHFFIEGGRGLAIAYFWFPIAPKIAPGVGTVDMEALQRTGSFATAHGSVNHVAFNVPLESLRDIRKRVKAANVGFVSPMLYHSDVDPSGYSPARDEHTVWESFYFQGPDHEYLEFTAQSPRPFTPEKDIRHRPAHGKA
jgi:catechol 2,3-dioxygenase-like lactoylglutathione lyase family enzyme